MRVSIRKEHPHPGARLTFADLDGLGLTPFATDTRILGRDARARARANATAIGVQLGALEHLADVGLLEGETAAGRRSSGWVEQAQPLSTATGTAAPPRPGRGKLRRGTSRLNSDQPRVPRIPYSRCSCIRVRNPAGAVAHRDPASTGVASVSAMRNLLRGPLSCRELGSPAGTPAGRGEAGCRWRPRIPAFLSSRLAWFRERRAFVVCGGAGALRADLTRGHLVVVESALRDEGPSHHYARAARYIEPDAAAVAS